MASRLLLLAASAMALNSTCPFQRPNTVFDGADVATTVQANAADCWTDCVNTTDCRHYVWLADVCHLKHTRGNVSHAAGAMAGSMYAPLCTAPVLDIDYVGYDVANTTRATSAECCSDCDATAGCALYVWHADTSTCVLKSQRGRKVIARGARASRVVDEPTSSTCPIVVDDVDYDTPQIGFALPRRAMDCCADCVSMPGCSHWVFANDTCSFRNGTGAVRASPGLLSGFLNASSTFANDESVNATPMPTFPTLPPKTTTPIPTFPTLPPKTTTPIPTFPTLPPKTTQPPTVPTMAPTTAPATAKPTTKTPAPTTAPTTASPTKTTTPLPPATTSPVPTTATTPITTTLPTTTSPTTTPVPTLNTTSPTTTTSPPSCASPRVRVSWQVMTNEARLVYVNAIAAAMDAGHYASFVTTFALNNKAAFGSSTLGPSFACVTVPYWDVASEANAWVAAQCRSVDECAEITRALGGVRDGVIGSNASLFGFARPDLRCVDGFPLNHLCDGDACCVPRADWRTSKYIAEVSPPLLKHFLFRRSTENMTLALETALVPAVHLWLGGAIANKTLAVVDPLVWSQFATVDALFTIHYKCVVEPRDGNSAYLAYLRRDAVDLQRPTNATATTWFGSVPAEFVQLVDTNRLSYGYDLSGPLGTLYDKCEKTNMPSKANRDAVAARFANTTARSDPIMPTLQVANDLVANYVEQLYALGMLQGLSPAVIDVEIQKVIIVAMVQCRKATMLTFTPAFAADWQLRAPAYASTLYENVRSGVDPIQLRHHNTITAHFLAC
ncbi:hypothetical protein SPRG_06490 [Saprolegnia parasitica CBS 223.65]|uniref:Apple domain-containing protein n=1 Tax=Saprolegnia parasitica (strain CBS 223.65) TaxID=695850 RepID=A0A067CHH5_SAPPC|nr:hypothetical protein SPRG_06490 [Saprolegnia parasitica CBS 223.65]KDO28635.1 hypothetical protein SPRG_06490 [Saprolegnia parasitica CBS 223.65]|eukprot:XP_012200697.1 hypothetical protein SPRG_06490 [Saprolegnia parasitica CBS 223.65]